MTYLEKLAININPGFQSTIEPLVGMSGSTTNVTWDQKKPIVKPHSTTHTSPNTGAAAPYAGAPNTTLAHGDTSVPITNKSSSRTTSPAPSNITKTSPLPGTRPAGGVGGSGGGGGGGGGVSAVPGGGGPGGSGGAVVPPVAPTLSKLRRAWNVTKSVGSRLGGALSGVAAIDDFGNAANQISQGGTNLITAPFQAAQGGTNALFALKHLAPKLTAPLFGASGSAMNRAGGGGGMVLTAHALSAAQGAKALADEGLTSGAPIYSQGKMDDMRSFSGPGFTRNDKGGISGVDFGTAGSLVNRFFDPVGTWAGVANAAGQAISEPMDFGGGFKTKGISGASRDAETAGIQQRTENTGRVHQQKIQQLQQQWKQDYDARAAKDPSVKNMTPAQVEADRKAYTQPRFREYLHPGAAAAEAEAKAHPVAPKPVPEDNYAPYDQTPDAPAGPSTAPAQPVSPQPVPAQTNPPATEVPPQPAPGSPGTQPAPTQPPADQRVPQAQPVPGGQAPVPQAQPVPGGQAPVPQAPAATASQAPVSPGQLANSPQEVDQRKQLATSPEATRAIAQSMAEKANASATPYTYTSTAQGPTPKPERPVPHTREELYRMSPQEHSRVGNQDAQAQSDYTNALRQRVADEGNRQKSDDASNAELQKHLDSGETVNLQGADGKHHGTMSRTTDPEESKRNRALLDKHNYVQGTGFKNKEDEAAYNTEKSMGKEKTAGMLYRRSTGIFDADGYEFVNTADLGALCKLAMFHGVTSEMYSVLPSDPQGKMSVRQFIHSYL